MILLLKPALMCPETETGIGYVEDLFPVYHIPSVLQFVRIVSRGVFLEISVLKVNCFNLFTSQVSRAVTNFESALAGTMDQVGRCRQVSCECAVILYCF